MRNVETSDGYIEEKVTGLDILETEITQSYLHERKKKILRKQKSDQSYFMYIYIQG